MKARIFKSINFTATPFIAEVGENFKSNDTIQEGGKTPEEAKKRLLLRLEQNKAHLLSKMKEVDSCINAVSNLNP